MSFFDTQPQNDIDKGRAALKYFHNHAARYQGYNLSMDEMINQVSKGKPSIFLEGMGFAINAINLSDSKVETSMENLADQGQGKIPDNPNYFYKALADQAQVVSWTEATGFVVTETAKTVLEGAQAVGENVLSTLKGINLIFPFLIIGGIIFISVSRIRKAA